MNLGKQRPYSLEPYNPDWPQWFLERKEKITPLFGDNLISIEHIGSTSIPGMPAKPNIDMLVVVRDLDVIPPLYQEFIDAGYTPQGREYVGDGDEYITEDTEDGYRITSIHVYQDGHPKIQQYRDFRDYLTAVPTAKQRYMDLKMNLYNTYRDDYASYDSGKTDTIEVLKQEATTWARERLHQK